MGRPLGVTSLSVRSSHRLLAVMTVESRSTGTTASPTRPRDGFLDLVRSASILRVVVIHLLGAPGFWFWPAPTFVAPGMPVVFFVSGALVRQTLRTVDGKRRSVLGYWRKTFRRLLLPYSVYYAVVLSICVVGDMTRSDPRWTVRPDRALLAATGFVIPNASRAMRHYTGHLWFMSAFLVLTLLAPLLVRVFERLGALVLALPFAGFAWAEWRTAGGNQPPQEIYKLATFAVPYVAGFWYTEPRFQRLPRWVFLMAAVVFGVAAWWYDGVRPGAVNASGIKHLLVGGGWFCVALAGAPALRHVAERYSDGINRISRRTFTIFLWGWTTSVFAWELASDLVEEYWGRLALFLVLSLGLLAIAVAAFGRFEDIAAGRPRSAATSESQRHRTSAG